MFMYFNKTETIKQCAEFVSWASCAYKVSGGPEAEGMTTLLGDVESRSITVGCWEFGLNLRSP